MSAVVLGVDACPGGWVGIRLGVECPVGVFAANVPELVALTGPVDVVGIDIPIGLPDDGFREADRLARLAVGGLRSSVFATPPLAVLTAPTHAEAVVRCRSLTGSGVSIQSYGLRHRILEVRSWAPSSGQRVVEIHPEVSFALLNGGPLTQRKPTWAGAAVRRSLLSAQGIELPDDLGLAGSRAAVDDVLDAAAVAWSALRVAACTAESLPAPPEVFADGWPAAIWR